MRCLTFLFAALFCSTCSYAQNKPRISAQGDLEALQRIVQSNPTEAGELLKLAAQRGETGMVIWVLEHPKSLFKISDKKAALQLAVEGGHTKTVRALLQYPQIPWETPVLPLAYAQGPQAKELFEVLAERILRRNHLLDPQRPEQIQRLTTWFMIRTPQPGFHVPTFSDMEDIQLPTYAQQGSYLRLPYGGLLALQPSLSHLKQNRENEIALYVADKEGRLDFVTQRPPLRDAYFGDVVRHIEAFAYLKEHKNSDKRTFPVQPYGKLGDVSFDRGHGVDWALALPISQNISRKIDTPISASTDPRNITPQHPFYNRRVRNTLVAQLRGKQSRKTTTSPSSYHEWSIYALDPLVLPHQVLERYSLMGTAQTQRIEIPAGFVFAQLDPAGQISSTLYFPNFWHQENSKYQTLSTKEGIRLLTIHWEDPEAPQRILTPPVMRLDVPTLSGERTRYLATQAQTWLYAAQELAELGKRKEYPETWAAEQKVLQSLGISLPLFPAHLNEEEVSPPLWPSDILPVFLENMGERLLRKSAALEIEGVEQKLELVKYLFKHYFLLEQEVHRMYNQSAKGIQTAHKATKGLFRMPFQNPGKSVEMLMDTHWRLGRARADLERTRTVHQQAKRLQEDALRWLQLAAAQACHDSRAQRHLVWETAQHQGMGFLKFPCPLK